jgi:hypothetical protein
MKPHFHLVVLCLATAGCRCAPPSIKSAEPARLVVTPETLVLGPVYLGQSATGVVSVVNEGGAISEADVSVPAPFSVDVASLRLVQGAAADLVVSFSPQRPGPASAVLLVGTLEVRVEAEGLEVSACLPTTVCADAHFDVVGAQCVEAPKPDGAACETSCVSGACSAGTCVGTLKGCDDGNACTTDACDETAGCSHALRACPQPTAPCQVARCDSATGCGTQDAPDGTLCGPDDCLATQVQVCIVGQCVTRPRPDTGRCVNRWIPTTIPARLGHAMAFDAAHQRVVLFGGYGTGDLSDTWERNGTTWTQRLPASSPTARSGHAMAYDAARQRVVLFGGQIEQTLSVLSDTWEWDGTTWAQRFPSRSPSARNGHYAMAYDAAHQRVVLTGAGETWEWDGTTWTQRLPALAPRAREYHAMAYDAARQRVVLFGGLDGNYLSETWEWDGMAWTQKFPASSPRSRGNHTMAYDFARQRVLLFGGSDGNRLSDTWEWDGATWVESPPATDPPARGGHAMVYDSARQRVVLFGGFAGRGLSDTWERGTTWVQTPQALAPPERYAQSGHGPAVAYDAVRQRVVLFGGFSTQGQSLSDTWEWDGATWTQRLAALSPTARFGHVMAYDAVHQRVVLFGGEDANGLSSETWEWDGTAWLQKLPASSPPARQGFAMASDFARQRLVLFGGADANGHTSETWEWDGTTWLQKLPASSPPARGGHAMAYDAARQRVVLFGGNDVTDSTIRLSDTWEWDGATWVESTPAMAPPARNQHAMVYDSARQRVVLLGGFALPRALLDTWEWDGTTWVDKQPLTAFPSALGAMAYDEARQRVTFFDGTTTWLLLP